MNTKALKHVLYFWLSIAAVGLVVSLVVLGLLFYSGTVCTVFGAFTVCYISLVVYALSLEGRGK